MLDWLGEHRTILYWLTGASVVLFVASLIVVPAVVIRIPADYFAHQTRPRRPGAWAGRHPAARAAISVGRNMLAAILILAGLAMLVLPGQGVLAIIAGVLMLDVPGKYRFERWLVSRPGVLRALNWLRRRAGKPPLRVNGQAQA